MADRVEITIKAIDKASKELDAVNRELGGMDKQGQKTSRSFKQMASTVATVTAGVAAFGYAAKQAFDIAKQGAELDLTRQRFDRLAESMGATSDVMVKDITKAMGGMASQAEAVQLATELMSLGLVKTREQAVRMAGVAGQLNMDMNQLALTLSNKTTMRFDSLGVSIDGFDEKVDKLSETMSDQDAFTMAFLSQAEEQIEKVGSAADTSAGEIAQLEAAWKDYSDTIKGSFLQAIIPFIEHANDQRNAVEGVEEAQRLGIMTAEDASRVQSLLNKNMIDNAEVLKILEERQAAHNNTVEKSKERYVDVIGKIGELNNAGLEGAIAAANNYQSALGGVNDALDVILTKSLAMSRSEFIEKMGGRIVSILGMSGIVGEGGGAPQSSGPASYGDTITAFGQTFKNAEIRDGLLYVRGKQYSTEKVPGYAGGGKLGGDAAVVGEKGYEFIFKDKNGEWIVVSHEQSKMLAQMGVIPGRGLYFGGPLGGGGGGPIPDDPYLPGSGGVKVPGGGLSAPVPPGVYLEGSRTSPSSGGGTSGSTSSSQQQAQQAATAAATSVGAQTTQAVVQSSQDTSQRFLNQFVEEQRKERQPLLDALGELKIEMRRLPQRLVDSLVLSGEV